MSPFRLLMRWVMTLLAIGLALLALLVLALRLAASQVDEVRPRLETLLSTRFNADVSMVELDGRWHGLDPALALGDLTVISRAGGREPLLEVEGARLRLDSAASLRNGVPVVDDAHLEGVTIHLYQTPERTWHWPYPAELPPELQPDVEFSLERLDYLVGVLLRQRVDVENLRLVLHGRDRQVTLEAPTLLMTGDRRRAHLEGQVYVEGHEEVSLEAALEILPGRRGLTDFNAALQARMDIASLVRLAEVLSRNDPVRLEHASGEAVLWGRWYQGALADVRLDLNIPELAMSHNETRLALEDIRARGQWLREDEGWQAWLSLPGDEPVLDAADEEPVAEEETGPALPRHWQLEGDGEGWRLKGSGFDLGALAAWRDRLPLPERVARLLDALEPRGQIAGFSLDHRDGRWQSRAALQSVAVSPWENVPGGGPMDAWVEAEDREGRVEFVGIDGTRLHFPKLFTGPMDLASAHGEVSWAYADKRVRIEGQGLETNWRGAQVLGDFDLEIGGSEPGELGLDLAFQDVDALDTPLVDWLPVGVLGDELNDWLAQGVAGRVPEGRLNLRLPLYEGIQPEDVSLDLALEVEQGHLPFAPDWPALDNVSGRLTLDDLDLEAWVDQAESRGLWAREGQVSLVDEVLAVRGEVGGTTEDLLSYLQALPFVNLQADDWESRGELAGSLVLSLPLAEPDAMSFDLATDVAVPYLRFIPLDLTLNDINGELDYRHRDEQGGLTGVLGARVFEGPMLARFDTREQQVTFEGRALARGLLEWASLDGLDPLLTGYFPYSASLSLDPRDQRLRLDSDLGGLAINLPPPFGKTFQESTPLSLDADLGAGRVEATLAERMQLRWRAWGQAGQGQVWLEQWPAAPQWPDSGGWEVSWRSPRLDPPRWASALSAVGLDDIDVAGQQAPQALQALRLGTDCLYVRQRCLGSLFASAYPMGDSPGSWQLDLAGSLLEGRAEYRPELAGSGPENASAGNSGGVGSVGIGPIDITLSRLNLDALLPEPEQAANLFEEIDVAPTPEAFPDWLAGLPAGRLRVADLERHGQRFGPLTARWRASPEQLVVAPLGLTLGEVSARGELVWEAAGPEASLTRSRLSLDGRDLGTALERLAQPISIRNESTAVESQLAWPGAPWQFALQRSRGSLDIELRNGRFRYLDSPSAKLIGLLNFDNLLRRLRLDFSDVTRQGTAFDSVTGAATLYGGILETRGPVEIRGPATSFTLNGQVDLARRELDQHLAVTVPLSQNLPLAAVVAGAPVVGGALWIAHRLFGGAIDRATRIHYRVRGPWTSPQIDLEGAE